MQSMTFPPKTPHAVGRMPSKMAKIELRDPNHVLLRLATMYDSAILYVLYDKRTSGCNYNVTTVIVRCNSDEVSTVQVAPDVRDVVGADSQRRFGLYRALISPAEADKFRSDSAAGEALLPHVDVTIRFAPGDDVVGFLPARASESMTASSPLRRSAYSRRRWATDKRVGRVPLSEANVLRLQRMLPDVSDVRFAVVDIRKRLDAIGDVEDLHPIGLSLSARSEDDGFHVVVEGRRKWREAFPDLDIHGTVGRRLASTADIVKRLTAADPELVLTGPRVDACDITLSSGGVLFDRLAGTVTRVAAVTANIITRRLLVEVDDRKTTVGVDVAKGSAATQVSVGSPDDATRRIAPAFFLGKRLEREQAEPFIEVLLDPLNGIPAVELYERLVDMVRASAGSPYVRIIDRFAINRDALGRIALAAAAARGPRLQILTNSRVPPGAPGDFDFDAEVLRIGKIAKVHIQIFQPTIDIHDRFLWVGDRIWHFGHSFNQYGGHGLSLVAEVRSVAALSGLREILEPQFLKPRPLRPRRAMP
jgi:hypothetical protein